MRSGSAANRGEEASVVRRAGRTAALAAAGAAALALAVGALMASGTAPVWLRTLLGPEPGAPALVALACFLLWLGAGPAWVASRLPRGPGSALGLPLWAFLAALPLYGLLWVFAGDWMAEGLRWGWLSTAHVVTVLAVGMLVLMLAATVASVPVAMGWQAASRTIWPLVLLGTPWLMVAWLALPREAWSGPHSAIFRAGPVPGEVLAGVVLAFVGASAALLARALWHRLRLLTVALPLAALLAVAGWFLMTVALASEAGQGEEAFHPFRTLVLADPSAEVPPAGLLVRWVLLQAGLVVALAYGQVMALAGEVRPAALAEPVRIRPAPAPGGPATNAAPPAPRRPMDPARAARVYGVLTVVGIVLAIYGSLVPLEVRPVPLSKAIETVLNLRYLELGIGRRADLVANLLLFVPLAFFAMGALTGAGTRPGRWLIGTSVALGLWALALGVEFTQIWFAPRTVSLNDVLAECTGTVLGIGVWFLVGGRFTRWFQALWHERDTQRLAVLLLGGYTVALVVFQLLPFDLVISGEELVRDLKGTRLNLVPLADLGGGRGASAAASAAAFLPVGYAAAVRWARRRGHVVLGLAAGFALAAMLETLQIFIHSRLTSTTDVVLSAGGAGLGGWLAVHFGPAAVRPYPQQGGWRALSYALRLGLAVGLVGLILGLKWGRFEFQWPDEGLGARLRSLLQVPFRHQYYNSEFEATVQLVADVGSAVVVGMVVASLLDWAGRPGRVAAAVVAALIGMVPEAGQVFLPQHSADLTTIVLAGAGAAFGTRLYRPFVRVFILPRSCDLRE